MSVQVRRRREAASFLASFVGAQGELIVDTTNNRVQIHDGATPGGFPAAKLAEVVTNTRTAVADANYSVLVSDRTIAMTALTAARIFTLPSASAYPSGTQLLVVDESGNCSTTNAITAARAGSDTINGTTSASIATAYGYLAFESNGVGKWTIVDQTPSTSSGTAASRTAVADASYTALNTDRMIAFTSLTTSRTVTLPAASAYSTGVQLFVIDETGNCGVTRPITIARAGSDTINGAASATLAQAYGFLALTSNGIGKWTLVDFAGATQAQLTNRNAVINGNFAINQRAYTSGTALTAGTYAHDRWKAGSGGGTYTFTAAVPDTNITITAGTLIQAVDAPNVYATTYWLSWAGTATARVWQGSASGTYAASPILVSGLTVGTVANIEFATGTLGTVQFEATLSGAVQRLSSDGASASCSCAKPIFNHMWLPHPAHCNSADTRPPVPILSACCRSHGCVPCRPSPSSALGPAQTSARWVPARRWLRPSISRRRPLIRATSSPIRPRMAATRSAPKSDRDIAFASIPDVDPRR